MITFILPLRSLFRCAHLCPFFKALVTNLIVRPSFSLFVLLVISAALGSLSFFFLPSFPIAHHRDLIGTSIRSPPHVFFLFLTVCRDVVAFLSSRRSMPVLFFSHSRRRLVPWYQLSFAGPYFSPTTESWTLPPSFPSLFNHSSFHYFYPPRAIPFHHSWLRSFFHCRTTLTVFLAKSYLEAPLPFSF